MGELLNKYDLVVAPCPGLGRRSGGTGQLKHLYSWSIYGGRDSAMG